MDYPVLWREGSAFNPRWSDVGDQPLHAIGTCPQSQLGKRCWYLAGQQKRHCHQFLDQSVGSIILFISSCKSQLLNLQRRQILKLTGFLRLGGFVSCHQPKYVSVSKKPKKPSIFFLTIARLEHWNCKQSGLQLEKARCFIPFSTPPGSSGKHIPWLSPLVQPP